jgi:hypothetical protein
MLSVPKKSFPEWVRQKRRHLMTGRYYSFNIKLLLGAYNFSSMLFYGLFFLLFFVVPPLAYKDWFWLFPAVLIGYFVLKTALQWILFAKIASKLGETGLKWMIPLIDFFFVIFTPSLIIINSFARKPKWK